MILGQKKALEIFLNKSIKARLTLGRLEKWDSEKTLKGNAESLGIDYQICVQLAINYGLQAKRTKNFQF